VAIVFSDNFNTTIPNAGLNPPWGNSDGYHPPNNNLATIDKWGYGGSRCVGCSSGQANYRLPFLTSGQGSIRMQLAVVCPNNNDEEGGFFASIADGRPTAPVRAFGLVVYVGKTGALSARVPDNTIGARILQVAPPGSFPVDGTQHGVQVRFIVTSTYTTVTFTVDNIDKGTITHPAAVGSVVWDYVFIYGLRMPGGGARPTDLWTIDNYELDDSYAAVDWPAGSAPKLDMSRICFANPFVDISGLYFINPVKTHDIYYNSIEKKIPDPTIKTGGIGE